MHCDIYFKETSLSEKLLIHGRDTEGASIAQLD